MPRSLIRPFFNLLLPPTCLGCAMRCIDPPLNGVPICAGCLASLRNPAARCAICAHASAHTTCPQCRTHPPSFDRTITLADYRPPLDRIIHALKYRAELSIARALGTLLSRRLDLSTGLGGLHGTDRPLLTAVPLAGSRLLERGFNQALEIARALGRARGLTVRADAIRRIRPGPPQAQLGPDARRFNIADAFEAERAQVAGRAVWVVDDVITTGATLDAVALALKRASAASVTNLVIARTPIDHVQRGSGSP